MIYFLLQGNEIFFTFVSDEYLYFNLNSLFMKKILLTAALILGLSFAASAQPRAIGAKFGWGLDLSYQHSFGTNFLEADLFAFDDFVHNHRFSIHDLLAGDNYFRIFHIHLHHRSDGAAH